MDISVILKLLSLGAVIVASVLWTSAQVDSRPKYNDEQTLVSGAIWTQIVISIGLIISAEVNDHLHKFVHGYFLIAGLALPVVTGVVLVCKTWLILTISYKRLQWHCLASGFWHRCHEEEYISSQKLKDSNKMPFGFILITGLLAFGAYWTTKYLMNMPYPQSSFAPTTQTVPVAQE